MEALQLAQMLADLSDLNAADPHAANALVNANKTIVHRSADGTISTGESAVASISTTPLPSQRQPIQRSSSAAAVSGPVSAPAPGSSCSSIPPASRTNSNNTGASTPFDAYLGRHLFTPALTRSSSSHSLSGNPRAEIDSDVDRASSLMALYELRAKLKQYNDSNSLRQAREKIAALSARQQAHDVSNGPASSSSPSQTSPTSRRHSQYSFPRT